MSPELDAALCKEFPKLYRDRNGDMRKTCMVWGFTCGDGWYSIVYLLSLRLEKLIEEFEKTSTICECWHDLKDHFNGGGCTGSMKFRGLEESCSCMEYEIHVPRAVQVKQKLGGLRVYMSSQTEEMYKAIKEAEELALVTCETCGEEGTYRGNLSFLQTLCNKCYKDYLDKWKD